MAGRTIVCMGLIGVLLGGCAGKKPVIPSGTLWEEANAAYDDEAYDYAVQRYKALLDQYPFDKNAEEAELKIAQAYYQSERYAEAIAAFANFERMHPTSVHFASVEYHRGLAYLAQYKSADRDQQAITNAQTSFRNVVDRFGTSPWAERARLRLRECREALARHEVQVATYYLERKSMRAAESRLRGLLVDYPETDATAEALHAFARSYTSQEESQGAMLAYAALVHLHPTGPLGVDAREQLAGTPPPTDAVPALVAFLDEARLRADRTTVPRAVSAYPDSGNASGARY
jgi:outer membrane protein assembly factor BamD